MKFLKQGLSLALLGASLTALPVLQATTVGTASAAVGGSLVQQMRGDATGAVQVTRERATGKVGFIRAARGGDLLPSVAGDSTSKAGVKASAYLAKYAPLLGAGASELKQSGVSATKYGWTVTYTQQHRGLPVFGAQLRANLDRAGDLTSVNGYVAPGLSLGTTPRFSAAQAADRAINMVRATPPGEGKVDLSGLRAASNTLSVYRMGAIRGEKGRAILAYVIEVTNQRNIRDMVFIDANTGKPVNRFSMIHSALDRELLEASINNGGTPDDPDDDSIQLDPVWREGDPLPGDLDEDQLSEVETTGDAYWFFRNTFGRDSYDDRGSKMITVNNDPRIECPNANWNGVTTNYCSGVSSDDTVAHEWGHAYTEYTSGLIYQWQSGAMNEAYSDIWGETVDMINDRQNDLPDTVRPVGMCSSHTQPSPQLTVNTPASIAKVCETGGLLGTLDGPITGDVVAPSDAVDEGGTATDGCSTYDDPAAAAGKIVLVDRGLCTFVQKAQVAKEAGAAAVIIGDRNEAPVSFSDGDSTLPTTVSIGLSDRESVRAALAGGDTVNVTIEDASGARGDSYRWLSGENDPASGGAIRDMWDPTCLGDPGKVSDAEYKCSTDDSGGVHSNSGVVNHAYSLLVDGGTYNEVTVPGIGLTKAAQVFWRTQTAYLNPSSDFQDLADGLVASCTDLTGVGFNEISTEPMDQRVSDELITPADCAAVAAVTQAVELNREPTQCNFQPLLAGNAPSSCGERFRSVNVFRENFERGLRNWTKSEQVVFDGGRGFPWRATSNVPDRDSKVAYAPAPDTGNCSGGPGDVSSSNAITSPAVVLPQGRAGRLVFKHYVATESGVDGGNVQIKVNRGPFQVVPASAYLFNPPSTLISADEGNTNPLAGQPGFTGTNGGVINGSWGTSIVNLTKAGVKAGDKVRIRFDMGRDGCGGNDGWYVDDVRVQVCKVKRD